jgi:hypothetical protein
MHRFLVALQVSLQWKSFTANVKKVIKDYWKARKKSCQRKLRQEKINTKEIATCPHLT